MYGRKIETTSFVEIIISDLDYSMSYTGPEFQNFTEEVDFLRESLGDHIAYPILFELMGMARNLINGLCPDNFEVKLSNGKILVITCLLKDIGKDCMGNPIVRAQITFNSEEKIKGGN